MLCCKCKGFKILLHILKVWNHKHWLLQHLLLADHSSGHVVLLHSACKYTVKVKGKCVYTFMHNSNLELVTKSCIMSRLLFKTILWYPVLDLHECCTIFNPVFLVTGMHTSSPLVFLCLFSSQVFALWLAHALLASCALQVWSHLYLACCMLDTCLILML